MTTVSGPIECSTSITCQAQEHISQGAPESRHSCPSALRPISHVQRPSHPHALGQGLAQGQEEGRQQRLRTGTHRAWPLPVQRQLSQVRATVPFRSAEGRRLLAPICTLQVPTFWRKVPTSWASCPSSSGLHTQQTPSNAGLHHLSALGCHSLACLFIQQTSIAVCPATCWGLETPCPRGHKAS